MIDRAHAAEHAAMVAAQREGELLKAMEMLAVHLRTTHARSPVWSAADPTLHAQIHSHEDNPGATLRT